MSLWLGGVHQPTGGAQAGGPPPPPPMDDYTYSRQYEAPVAPPMPTRLTNMYAGGGNPSSATFGCSGQYQSSYEGLDAYAGFTQREPRPAPPPLPPSAQQGHARPQWPGYAAPGSVPRRQQPAPPPSPPPEPPQAAVSAPPTRVCPTISQQRGPAGQEQYLVDKDGGRYCLLCNQWADEPHLGSKKHLKRAETPEWYLYGDDASPGGPPEAPAAGMPQPPPPAFPPQQELLVERPPVLLSGKKCSYCAEPAIDRDVPGSKSKYCQECWNWWTVSGEGSSGQAGMLPTQTTPRTSGPAPPPPPVGMPTAQVSKTAPAPPPPTMVRSQEWLQPEPREESNESAWLQPDEIEV